jgi:hypothetical protein
MMVATTRPIVALARRGLLASRARAFADPAAPEGAGSTAPQARISRSGSRAERDDDLEQRSQSR